MRAFESLAYLQESGVAFEVRITVHATLLPRTRLECLLNRLEKSGVRCVMLQRCRDERMLDTSLGINPAPSLDADRCRIGGGEMHGRKAMPDKDHWDGVYRDRAGDDLSWYQAHAEQSLELINRCGLDREAPLIDIGGGTSYLAAALLQLGYRDVSVLDISPVALVNARAGLGSDAACALDRSRCHEGASASRRFALWHDRAVFHFNCTV